MKKKIVLYSEESFFGGTVNCGIAEVVDSLAITLADIYEVYVVCREGDTSLAKAISELHFFSPGIKEGKLFKVNYILINSLEWPNKSYSFINNLKPDIIHNFEDPNLILHLNFKSKMIYTFDDINYIKNKIQILKRYDYVTSFSKAFIDELLQEKENSFLTEELKLKKVSIGILDKLFNPEKGLLLPYAYNILNLNGKNKCKKRILETYHNGEDSCIFLFAARLVKQKGLDNIVQAIDLLTSDNNFFIIIGTGEKYYEDYFQNISKNNKNIFFINEKLLPTQVMAFLSGADFYIQPSLQESGGLMPMTASCYGTIPIVTLNGGLKDNFNKENAIVVKENNLYNSIKEAIELYNNKEMFEKKIKTVMNINFSWEDRKIDFIKLYEN